MHLTRLLGRDPDERAASVVARVCSADGVASVLFEYMSHLAFTCPDVLNHSSLS